MNIYHLLGVLKRMFEHLLCGVEFNLDFDESVYMEYYIMWSANITDNFNV